MCLISANATARGQLDDLGEPDALMIVDRLVHFAEAANKNNAGPLDAHRGVLKYLPDDLRHVRHYHVGRHRVYVSGSCRECNYYTWMVKAYKKTGTLDEGSPKFNAVLRRALSDGIQVLLP